MASKKAKKRSNPRISKRKRSAAAKKGWQTRRQNDPVLAQQYQEKQLKKKAVKARRKRTVQEKMVEKEVKRRLPKKMFSQEEVDKLFSEYKIKTDIEYESIRSKLVSDTLRAAIDSAPADFVYDDYQIIRSRMSLADMSGDPNAEAEKLADEFNMDTREIFTIWLSP